MPTIAPNRTAADVTDDIKAKRARETALQARLDACTEELATAHEDEARCVADGVPLPDTPRSTTLTAEREQLQRALRLLASDRSTLEKELKTREVSEADDVMRDAITKATAAVARMNQTLRDVAEQVILPADAQMRDALSTVRSTSKHFDYLQRREPGNGSLMSVSRVDRIIKGRGKLLQAIEAIRQFVNEPRDAIALDVSSNGDDTSSPSDDDEPEESDRAA